MGATTKGDGRSTDPIFMGERVVFSVCPDVSRVDLDGHRLADEADRQHQPGVAAAFPLKPSHNAAKRSAHDFNERPFL